MAVRRGPDTHDLDAGRDQRRLGLDRRRLGGDDPDRHFTRGASQLRGQRQFEIRVENDPYRRVIGHARQTHRHLRVVREHGTDTEHDRVVMRPLEMHPGARCRRRDGDGRGPRSAGVAIGRPSDLEGHHRPPLRHPQDMAAMGALRLILQHAGDDLDARGAQQRMAEPGDEGVGIRHRRNHALHAGQNGVLDAGDASPQGTMRAGFERDIERTAHCRGAGAGAGEGERLAMRASPGLGQAAGHHDRPIGRVLGDDGADRGVGPGSAEIARAEVKRLCHEGAVDRIPVSHQRGAAGRKRPPPLRWYRAGRAVPRNPWPRGSSCRPRRSGHRPRRRAP